MNEKVRIGVVGTSWWADAMYLPALTRHPLADVRGVVGTRQRATPASSRTAGASPARSTASTRSLPPRSSTRSIVLAPNRLHYPFAMAAIERGLHVLCEKPLAMTAPEARRLADAAERAGLITMCPFTYSFMPLSRWVKELVADGYIGRPYHLNMRYYASYGRSGDYMWRFDLGEAGAGTGGDLGSHWAYLARWYFGEIAAVTAVFGRAVDRGPRPDGAPYSPAEDSAMILLEFESGATGSSTCRRSPTSRRRTASCTRWSSTDPRGRSTRSATGSSQRVHGCDRLASPDEPAVHELPIPDRIFDGARRDTVSTRTRTRSASTTSWPAGS